VELQVYHGTRYIDEVVGLRVKDQGRLYAHQDANWNVTALTDLTGRVIEQYWYSPYGQLEAHVASHPFDFDDDGDVDAQDIAAGTSGGTCWGDYDGASGDCKRLDADGDRDIDVDDYTIVNNFLAARHSEAALQRIPAASYSRRGNLFAHQGLPLDAELASYQNRARQYAPAARRFMQLDPYVLVPASSSGYHDGVNLFLYLKCRTLQHHDPYGRGAHSCPSGGGTTPLPNVCETPCGPPPPPPALGESELGAPICDGNGNCQAYINPDWENTPDAILSCLIEHECKHCEEPDTSCCGKFENEAPRPPANPSDPEQVEDRMNDECAAYTVQMGCLNGQLPHQDPLTDSQIRCMTCMTQCSVDFRCGGGGSNQEILDRHREWQNCHIECHQTGPCAILSGR
jgi:RHS repeat-associated protein